ncbi:TIR domain-containing protein [Thermodesulfobacteriota bacterium]
MDSVTEPISEIGYQVFVSYAREDRTEALEIKASLEGEPGVTVFMAEKSIPGGTQFAEYIRKNLERSSELCLLFSPSSKESDWVLVECGVAFGFNLRITPVLLRTRPEELPAFTSSRNAKDFHKLQEYAHEVSDRASPTALLRFLVGSQEPDRCQVIAHCDDSKFTQYNMIAPGRDLENTLNDCYDLVAPLEIIEANPGDREKNTLQMMKEIRQKVNPWANGLFLLDSPRSNQVVDYVLSTYGQWVSGGQIRFRKYVNEDDPADRDAILLDGSGKEFVSDRFDLPNPHECQIGPFTDYFLLMRLPGSVLGLLRQDSVAWIICGIHSKASVAAARLFFPSPLRKLLRRLQVHGHAGEPTCFQGVFRVPKDCKVNQKTVEGFPTIDQVHLGHLRSRRTEATADDLDRHALPYFADPATYDEIELQIAHLDLVADCNFHCDGCIETPLRQRGMRLTFRAILDILCTLKDCGCRKVGFYGGEPTLHLEFPRVLRVASHMGFDLVLVTNGSRLHREEIRSAIKDCHGMQVRVSIDAGSQDTHSLVHGITGTPVFQQIVDATAHLIHSQVHVNISFLLRPSQDGSIGNIGELSSACKFWQEAGAKQFCIRPITEPGGTSPRLPTGNEAEIVRSVLARFGDFVSTPDWFRQSLAEGRIAPQPKAYRICYSAMYRIVISPWRPNAEPREGDPGAPIDTDLAWMSFCSYRRNDRASGGVLRKPFEQTWRQLRGEKAEWLNPHQMCNEVLCCRHTYNEGVAAYLRSTWHVEEHRNGGQ